MNANVKSVLEVVAGVVFLHEMMQKGEKRNYTFLIFLQDQTSRCVQSGISTSIKNADTPVRERCVGVVMAEIPSML